MDDRSETHPVDRFVGARLRALRLDANISQSVLGDALGITSQQIQKYEHGLNRISASVLFEAARTLGVSVAAFFEGYEPAAEGARPSEIRKALKEESNEAACPRLENDAVYQPQPVADLASFAQANPAALKRGV